MKFRASIINEIPFCIRPKSYMYECKSTFIIISVWQIFIYNREFLCLLKEKYVRTLFSGFENTPVDTNLIMGEKAIPDKYQMRTTQTMAYNEKATEIPDKLIENAAEAEVRTVDLSKNILPQVPEK